MSPIELSRISFSVDMHRIALYATNLSGIFPQLHGHSNSLLFCKICLDSPKIQRESLCYKSSCFCTEVFKKLISILIEDFILKILLFYTALNIYFKSTGMADFTSPCYELEYNFDPESICIRIKS